MKNLLSPTNPLFQLMIQNQKNTDIRLKYPIRRLPVNQKFLNLVFRTFIIRI